MIRVYKKNELFIIENTVTDIIYPNLTREEAIILLKKFDRNEPEHRCDFAIKEDNISFEYASLDDKDKTIAEQRKQIADLEAKLTEKDKEIEKEYNDGFIWEGKARDAWDEIEKLKQQLAEKGKEIESLKASSDKNIDYLIEFASLIDNEKDCNRMLKALDRVKKGKKYIVDKEHQDKISFAIAELEKVKEACEEIPQCDEYGDDWVLLSGLTEYIDNQIAELTHQHEDKGE